MKTIRGSRSLIAVATGLAMLLWEELLAQARCDISPSTRDSYEIHVLGSDEGFELQAHPQATPHAGVYVLDHLGRRQWRDETS